MRPLPEKFSLSILIPLFNEQDNIRNLYEQLNRYTSEISTREIIFINDGSTDGTLEALETLRSVDPKVHYISLSRNFGHQNALKAGLDHCSGDVVISMDGDLQHPPGLIPEMIEKWQAGYDIVVTTRSDAEAGNFLKRFTSRNFYWLMSSFSNIELKPGSADFRLLDRTVVDVLKTFEETDIFYRGYVAWSGFKQFEIPYIPEKRQAGTTKYTPRKRIRLALDGLLGFSILPLRLVTMIGVVISMASFLYGFYAICIRLFSDTAVSGWASTMAGIYFLGGIQLLCIGICGEYIGRTFMEVKKRPHYIIGKTSLGGENSETM